MKCLVINIDTDPQSWLLTKAECDRIGLPVERFSATVGDNRPLAFNQSVYRAMESCVLWRDSYSVECSDLLLLEDDVVFEPHTTMAFLKMVFLMELPEDFMTCHIGANIIGTDTMQWAMPEPYSENLAKLNNCWQSHATLYSAECVRYIIQHLNASVLDEKNMIFDEWLRTNVLHQGRSFVMKPMQAWQRPRHSEIWNQFADYTGAHLQGNIWLKNNL